MIHELSPQEFQDLVAVVASRIETKIRQEMREELEKALASVTAQIDQWTLKAKASVQAELRASIMRMERQGGEPEQGGTDGRNSDCSEGSQHPE